jgi:hypothetical protein
MSNNLYMFIRLYCRRLNKPLNPNNIKKINRIKSRLYPILDKIIYNNNIYDLSYTILRTNKYYVFIYLNPVLDYLFLDPEKLYICTRYLIKNKYLKNAYKDEFKMKILIKYAESFMAEFSNQNLNYVDLLKYVNKLTLAKLFDNIDINRFYYKFCYYNSTINAKIFLNALYISIKNISDINNLNLYYMKVNVDYDINKRFEERRISRLDILNNFIIKDLSNIVLNYLYI